MVQFTLDGSLRGNLYPERDREESQFERQHVLEPNCYVLVVYTPAEIAQQLTGVVTDHFDISKVLNQELEIGPLHLNLSDIDWPSDIQQGLNALNTALDATFVLYAIGIAAAGCAIIAALVALFLNGSRLVSFGNWGLATLSFLTFLVASIIVTIVQEKAAHVINKYGNEIGVYAYKGVKYLTLTWVSVAVMALAAIAWVVEFCIGRRNKGREYTEKTSHRTGWRRRRSDEAALRRSGV